LGLLLRGGRREGKDGKEWRGTEGRRESPQIRLSGYATEDVDVSRATTVIAKRRIQNLIHN